RIEADPCKIVTAADLYFFRRGFHQLNCCADGVLHVHHWKGCVFREEGFISSLRKRLVKNVNRIICGSSARGAFPAYESGIPKAPDIDIEFIEIPLAPAFPGLLADAI